MLQMKNSSNRKFFSWELQWHLTAFKSNAEKITIDLATVYTKVSQILNYLVRHKMSNKWLFINKMSAAISCFFTAVWTTYGSNREGAEKSLSESCSQSYRGCTSGLFPRRRERELKRLEKKRQCFGRTASWLMFQNIQGFRNCGM